VWQVIFIGGIMVLIKRISAALVAAVIFSAPVMTAFVSLQSSPVAAQTPAADPAKPADAAASPAAAMTAPVAAAASTKDELGVKAIWDKADYVAKAVLFILVVMSMGSWYILIVKFFEQRRLMKESKAATETFWNAGSLSQGMSTLHEDSAFRFIAEGGLKATERHGGLMGDVDFNTWVTMSIQRATDNVNSRLGDGLAFLATVGSTSPFVGLFGTVWGIYHALVAIGQSGQSSLDKVAGPIGEALIMTAIGLAVAVPAVLSYNWLIRRNKTAMEQVRAFSSDLHSVLMSQGSKAK
jgi:biopolymer transport protein ExbB